MAGFMNVSSYFTLYVIPFTVSAFFYSLALLYNVLLIYRILYRALKDPHNAYKLFRVAKRPIPPPILETYDHKYIQLKYVKLHYVDAGDSEKPLMLFVHGFPEFWFSWRHQIKEFSGDYWTVAFDMRGYGDSEKPQGTNYYKMKYLVEDIKNLIEGLGRKKCILVSHDWGGVVCWNFIKKYPEYVDKYVVLNAPDPRIFRRHMLSSFKQFKMSWYIFAFQIPFIPEMSFILNDMEALKRLFRSKKRKTVLNEEEMEAYKYHLGKAGAITYPLNYYRANFLTTPYKIPKVEGEQTNTEAPKGLLIFGDADLALDIAMVETMKKYIPNLSTDIVPGACHFVHQEEPERVNSSIKEFLNAA